jgi:hypothetical protein
VTNLSANFSNVANDAKKNKKIREIQPIRVIRVKSFWAFERVTYVLATAKITKYPKGLGWKPGT